MMFDAATWRLRLAEIRAILENDRRFLLTGRIDRLTAQDPRRRSIEARLTAMPQSLAREERKTIDQIRSLATRNHRLLEAYLEGARRAAARIGAAQREAGRLGAYRSDGSRIEALASKSTKEQRA